MSNTTNTTKYGLGSLENNLGNDNTGIGAYAAYNNLDASNNTAIGSNSAFFNTTGSNNTSLGAGSICNNTTGALNTAIGSSALEGIVGSSVGNQNTAVGAQSLYTNQGSLNTAIGTYSALGVMDGNYNTFLGANTSTLSDINCDYSTAIGYNAKVDASNQIMMGGNNSPFGYPNVIIPGKAYLPNFVSAGAVGSQLVTKAYVDSLIGGSVINPGQGLNETMISGSKYFNVDTSLNFINFLDSTSGVNGANGSLVLGGYSTNTIIGPTGGNPVQFQSQIVAQMGITGPTGSFTFISSSSGITGPTGSFTILNTPTITNTTTTTPYRITATDRIYQQLGPNPSYNAVNNYYGLAQDAYPALNPYSSGVKAVSSWTTRTTNNNTWASVTWSPELRLFAAVASNGSVTNGAMTSPDGINWTTKITNTNQWRRVIWAAELGLFVATAIGPGVTNKVMYSSDGNTWTATSNGVLNLEWFGLCWSPELRLLVAVSRTGDPQRVMTSTDAINWTARNSPTTAQWINVVWVAELSLFVAVGITGGVMTSPDGIDWTVRTLTAPNSSRSWVNVNWSSTLGLFVAVAQDTSTDVIMTSPDAITWTNRTSPVSQALYDVVWASELELFVIVGNNGTILTSPNGITWNSRTSPNANQWFGLTWAPELGIFSVVSISGSLDRSMTSSLAGRPPTSYNVFDSSFNSIDQNGNWTFSRMTISNNLGATPTLTVRDTTANQGAILLLPNVPLANYNPGVKTGDKVIVTQSSTVANRQLFLTINDGPNTGVRIASNIVIMGAGGTNPDPVTRITTNGSTNTIDISGGTIDINGSQINLDAATIDFQNTTTTTSTTANTATIQSTSSISTTNFLKVKLNNSFIWIPYFTSDPSV